MRREQGRRCKIHFWVVFTSPGGHRGTSSDTLVRRQQENSAASPCARQQALARVESHPQADPQVKLRQWCLLATRARGAKRQSRLLCQALLHRPGRQRARRMQVVL